METTPKEFDFEINQSKILHCTYSFSHQGVNEGSGYINLFIKPNDPDRPDLNHIKVAVKESIMELPDDVIERVARSELLSFYIMDLKKLDDAAKRTAYLIAGYIQQTLTPQEHDKLDAWVEESDDNMRLFEELTDEKNIEAMLQLIKQQGLN